MQPQLLDLFGSIPTFDNFVPFNNEIVIKLLRESNSQFTHVVGAKLSGKTHILQAWINSAPLKAIYLNATDKISLRELSDEYKYIAIDNIDQLNQKQQIQLFDLFNKIKLNNRDFEFGVHCGRDSLQKFKRWVVSPPFQAGNS